jgi:hypothetical protein
MKPSGMWENQEKASPPLNDPSLNDKVVRVLLFEGHGASVLFCLGDLHDLLSEIGGHNAPCGFRHDPGPPSGAASHLQYVSSSEGIPDGYSERLLLPISVGVPPTVDLLVLSSSPHVIIYEAVFSGQSPSPETDSAKQSRIIDCLLNNFPVEDGCPRYLSIGVNE